MLGRNKVLLVVLAALVVVFVIIQYGGDDNSSFKETLVEIDTAQVDRFIITASIGKPIGLIKKDGIWKVETFGGSFEADRSKVESILAEVDGLKSKRLVGKDEKDWSKFETDQEKGKRIQFYAENDLLADLMVGKFDFIQNQQAQYNPYSQQPQGEMLTYIRLYDEMEVYATESFLKMILSDEPQSYRDKKLSQFDPEKVDQVLYATKYGEPFILSKKNGVWLMGTQEVDSVQTKEYIKNASKQKGRDFANGYMKDPNTFYASVDFKGPDMEPVSITAFEVDSADFVLESSQYPMRYFQVQGSNPLESVFVGKEYFLKNKAD